MYECIPRWMMKQQMAKIIFSLPFYGIYNVDKALGWVSG